MGNRVKAPLRRSKPRPVAQSLSLTAAVLIVAGCGGGGGDSAVETQPAQPRTFKVQQFFQNILVSGASYSLRGQFTEGTNGPVSEQQHDQISFPVAAFAGPWRGYTDIQRRQVRVTRIVDGAAGVTDVYNGYFDSNNIEVGSQADNQDDYILFGPHVRQPASAQIGDSGGGPIGQRYMGDGSVRDQFLQWQINADGQDKGRYCQTVTETTNGTWNWDQTWCYSLYEDGTPAGFISYEYDAGGGFVGRIADENLQYPLNGPAASPSTTRQTSYKIAEYFNGLREDGVTYTLIGEFRDGSGNVTQQRHAQTRSPAEPFGQFKSYANTNRQVVQVNRTVDGLPGLSNVYNRYYNSNGVHVATQEEGVGTYFAYDLYRNRPVSAQIGDSGSGPDATVRDATGQQTGTRTLSRWEMIERDGMPLYCETIDETDLNDQQVWQFTWCYNVETDGGLGPYLSFAYDAGNGSVGLLEANDLKAINVAEPPPAPPPACQIDCTFNPNSGF